MTDHNIGLTTAEANRRAAAGMSNATEKHTSKTVGQIIRSNTLTAFNILFFFFAILVITTGSFNNLTFIYSTFFFILYSFLLFFIFVING